jgi:hypothetical protein
MAFLLDKAIGFRKIEIPESWNSKVLTTRYKESQIGMCIKFPYKMGRHLKHVTYN